MRMSAFIVSLFLAVVFSGCVSADRFPRWRRCSTDVTCPAGQQAIAQWGANATCTACPFDTFKAAAGVGCCTSCGAGTTNRTAGSTSCLCPPGTYKLSSGECRPCSRTSYSTGWDVAACDACPGGGSVASWRGTSCICPPGTQAMGGSSPAGVPGCTNCTGNTANPWPTNSTEACKACPATSISLDGVMCVCPAGSFAQFSGSGKASAASVAPADKGWWWVVSFNFTCTPCQNNTIQPHPALALWCKPCQSEQDLSIANPQHTACECATGFYATSTSRAGRRFSKWRAPACVACANGTTTAGPGLYTSCNITA